MPEMSALAKKIKEYRKANALSQSEFAIGCGISEDLLSLIEREQANPTVRTLQRIAEHTHMSVSDLLSLELHKEE